MPHARARLAAVLLLVGGLALAPRPAGAQQQAPVSVSFENTRMNDVLAFFAEYAGRSIVSGVGVDGMVTAKIERQRWDTALQAILDAHGFVGREAASGIIVVEDPRSIVGAPVRLVTRVFRLNYSPAAELQPVIAGVLSPRGSVTVVTSMNALVVTDEPRVLEKVAGLMGSP